MINQNLAKIRNEIKKKSIILSLGYFLISSIVFIGFWYLFVIILQLSYQGVRVVPYPHETFESFFNLIIHAIDGHTLWNHVGASLLRVLIGLFYAFVVAVPLGIIIALNRHLDRIIKPIIELLRPIPPIAWIPFAIITFGLTTLSHAFIIFIGAFFPLLQNTYDGVRQSTKVYQDVALSLGASKPQIAIEIILPSIFPNIRSFKTTDCNRNNITFNISKYNYWSTNCDWGGMDVCDSGRDDGDKWCRNWIFYQLYEKYWTLFQYDGGDDDDCACWITHQRYFLAY